MTTQTIGLFKALSAKMDYLNARQSVIAQNIANTDTPGYKPMDLAPVDFSTVLKNTGKGSVQSVSIRTTDPQHAGGAGDSADLKEKKQKKFYEVTPSGNAVVMEEQMLASNQTVTDYNLMTSLYQKNIRMIQIALGVQ